MASIEDSLRLAEMICARLCHDLSGLLGTLDAAIALAADDRAESEALDTAVSVSGELIRRLRLLRAAWTPGGPPMTHAALRGAADGLPRPERIAVELSALAPSIRLSPDIGRVLLNVLLLASEALPLGGEIVVAGSEDDLFIRIAGAKAGWPPDLAACLADPVVAKGALVSARTMQMPLTALLAHAAGLRLSLLLAPGDSPAPPPLRLSRT